jgi:mono/diheme cytochrome c family protein
MGRSTHMARLGFLLGAGLSLTASAGAATPTPTYHRDVARILQQHCQDCHRPGEVAPFSLLTYSHARKRASDIVTVTESRKMPPWPASTTEGGPFRDARVMSPAEIAVLAAWVAADCPEGDPKDAPPARTWTSDWALGEPDLVLSMPAAYTLTADGRDEHRVFVIPSGLTEGKWLSAIDFKPGNPRVVHHILAAFDTAGRARKLDADDPAPGYKVFGGFNLIPSGGLGGWAPGKRPQSLPSGVGRYLPARADVLLQVHYHKNGKAESDATRIGLYFAKGPIDKQVAGGMVTPPRSGFFRPKLLIPAGVANHEVTGAFTIAEDSHLTAVVPHMHWLGKDFLLKATRPDGSTFTLIRIDDWNFNWQGTYDFEQPIAVPKGTRIDMLAHFDNSAKNPANPNSPPKDVTWGEQTTDEMCIGFFQRTIDSEHRKNSPPARFQVPIAPAGTAASR